MTGFGPIVTADDVSAATVAHIRNWMPTYLAVMERHTDRDAMTLPQFRSYVNAADTAWDSGDQLPACVVVVPGLADQPYREGSGPYTADWLVHVAAVVTGQDRENSESLAKVYAAALRLVFVQHGALGGFADSTEWTDERYDDLPFVDERMLGVGVVTFIISVANVVSAFDGPIVPPADPYADPAPSATVETVFVESSRRS